MEKVRMVWQKICDFWRPIDNVFRAIGRAIAWICKWIMHLRKIFLAIPVVYGALRVAEYANEHLPEKVGLNLLENGEYAYTVTKEIAVLGPLAITAACLLLMFCSKRTLYPWLISLFSLVLPLMILLTNIFPT